MRKGNIGAASLVLIFLVLCMGTFVLLALSGARSDLELANRQAQAVQEYYEADAKGQEWLQSISKGLVGGAPGEILTKEIAMPRGQSLLIEVELLDGNDFHIKSYVVYDSGEYAVDSKRPVWDGKVE